MRHKITPILFILLLFSACTNHHKKERNDSLEWNKVLSWAFKGKMAINNGRKSGSGRILWKANNDSIHAEFKAPLGQGSWHITESPREAILMSSQHGESIARNAEILITNELGWHFPWNSLKYWVRGYLSKQHLKPHSQLPITINDNGWNITYSKWMPTSIGMLPKKIKASKENYSVKLIIYQWDINTL